MRKAFTLFALLLAFTCLQTSAQDRTITGKVTSSQDNLGIPGVTVFIEGTTNGVSTDIDGNYSITVPATATKLKFSTVGMKTKVVDITSDKVDVTLDPDVLKLEEVVVTANAITREKRSLGYATQQVTNEDLTDGQNTNVIGAMQGKVAGVNITSLSGSPGSSQRIIIRGGSSIAYGNQPLIVIDGVPMNNGNVRTGDDLNNQVDYGSRLNDLNPDDIESISVLKSASSAALYGSAGANGAIMITTKKGKKTVVGGKSRMEVAFHSSVTYSEILKTPDFQNKYGQGDVDFTDDDRRENFSWGLPFDDKLRPWGQEINGQQRVKPYSAMEDNYKDFFNTGIAYNNNLSFAGGSEKSSYYMSIGALNSKGIVETSRYNKYNIHFNGSSELANHITTSISMNYSNVDAVLPSGGQRDASIYDQVLQTPRDIPITDGRDLDDPFNAYNDVTGQYGYYGAYTTNPYFVLNNFKNTQKIDRILGNIAVTYKFNDWISLTDRLGGDFYGERRYQKWKKYAYTPIDPFYGLNNQIYQGKYGEDLFNYSSTSNDLMLNMNHSFSEDLKVTAVLGYNVFQESLSENNTQTNFDGGLAIPGYYNLQNSNGPVLSENTLTQKRKLGYYADINFAYKNYLFFGLTGRVDKSSTLPEDKNTYFYPSANVSFVLSEFFNDNLRENSFTYCKLRAAYARVGNDAPAYSTTSGFVKTSIDGGFGITEFPLNGVNGFTRSDRLANPELTPEFTTEFEVGADLAFLKDRLSVGFSYYNRLSTDQIIPLPLPPSSGYTSKIINSGEISNKGFEIELRGTPVLLDNGFKWELYGTYFANTNNVEKLYQGVDQLNLGGTSRTSIVAEVGKPIGSFYAVDLLKDPEGRVVVDSVTGQPMLTSNLVYVGNYQPDFQASIGTNFFFKGFTLGFLFDIKQGGQFSSRTKDVMDFVGISKETESREDQIWPNSVYQGSDGSYIVNTTQQYHPYAYWTAGVPDGQHIVDASYVKLREAHLTYTFPSKWLDSTPFGSASLTLFGNNLMLWTPEENQYADPEQNSSGASNAQGFEFTSNPSQRNYGFDLKLTF